MSQFTTEIPELLVFCGQRKPYCGIANSVKGGNNLDVAGQVLITKTCAILGFTRSVQQVIAEFPAVISPVGCTLSFGMLTLLNLFYTLQGS